MQNSLRPSHVLVGALASLGQGCYDSCSGPRPTVIEIETLSGDYPLLGDERVLWWDDRRIDPRTGEGCDELCLDLDPRLLVTAIESCEASITMDAVEPDADPEATAGTVAIVCVVSHNGYACLGRHHADLIRRASGRGPEPIAAWLGREANGEAGSITAFRRLATELSHHGAPATLVARALDAARDEVRHAREVGALASARGGTADPIVARAPHARDLRALALENAVEGCVLETYAAARAGHQAQHAVDADVRRVCATLAQDEARHADLAADIHTWALSRLSADDAEAVERARCDAWRRLAEHPEREPADVRRVLGLPDEATARTLARLLATGLGVALPAASPSTVPASPPRA